MRILERFFQRLTAQERKATKLWRTIAGMMAVIITFVTTYSLILPAITVSRENVQDVAGMYLEEPEDAFEIVEDTDEEPDHPHGRNDFALAGAEADTSWEGDLIEDDAALTETEAETERDGITSVETVADAETEPETELNTEAETESGTEVIYPSQQFTAGTDGIRVMVNAPAGAFPEGTTMSVSRVEDEEILRGIEEAASAEGTKVRRTEAVDICFRNAGGEEIEPLAPVSVCMVTENSSAEQSAVVVHVDDNGNAETVEDAVVYTSGNNDRVVLTQDCAVSFESEQFSIYAIVYTVELRFGADGDTYTITVTYDEDAAIPDDAELKVHEILPDDQEYAGYLKQAEQTAYGAAAFSDEAERIEMNAAENYARFFDIEIQSGGRKIEPAAPVTVDISLTDAPQTETALKVVHFDEKDGPVLMQAEARSKNEDETANVRFETDSFSVYAVLKDSELNDNDLDGWSVTISRNGQYMTADTDYNYTPNRVRKTGNPAEAATWYFESPDPDQPGKYYLYTLGSNGGKRYLELKHQNGDDNDEASAKVLDNWKTLFTVSKRPDGRYTIKTEDGYYLNEYGGNNGPQNGFSGWNGISDNNYLTLDFKNDPTAQPPGSQYAVIIKNNQDNRYYAVQNNGSLVEVEYSEADNVARVKLDYPLLWTYTSLHDKLSDDTKTEVPDEDAGKAPYNIRVAVDARGFDGNQLPQGNYFRYICPNEEGGLYDEPENSNHTETKKTGAIEYSGNKIYAVEEDGSTWNNNGYYIGADFDNMHITGKNDADNAATVYFAKIETIPDGGSNTGNNETVNHIDIAINGMGILDVPLAYGTYYDENKNPILTVSKGNDVTAHLEQKVPIDKKDMMAASIKAYSDDKFTNELDSAFYITGYTANDDSGRSEVQVRMEGSFKVDTLDPADFSQYGSEENHNLNARWRALRKENQVYYKVSLLKDVEFDLMYNGQVLCDSSGKPMKVKAKVQLSGGFSYWDEDNECPPLLENFEDKYHMHPQSNGGKLQPNGFNHSWWEAGAIVDNNWGNQYYRLDNLSDGGYGLPGESGMDFRLGGVDDGNGKTVAVEIVKIIENENGERIHPGSDITNDFMLRHSTSALPSDVRSFAVPVSQAVAGDNSSLTSMQQNGYTDVRPERVVVGEEGIGVTYDYDVDPGMLYINEYAEPMAAGGSNHEITDVNGHKWTYVTTRVETEYVWRDNEYNGERHCVNGYSSVPEVLGSYQDDHGVDQRNAFLEFYVYNVYKADTTDLKVEKKWEGGSDIPGNATADLVLRRYKLVQGGGEMPAQGRVGVKQEFIDLNNVRNNEGFQYQATYTLKNSEGQQVGNPITMEYDPDHTGTGFLFDTLLAPGDYTVECSCSVTNTGNDGVVYTVSPTSGSETVHVSAGDVATAVFTNTLSRQKEAVKTYHVVYLHATGEEDWVSPDENGHRYVLKRYMEYEQGTQVTMNFHAAGNPFWVYETGHHVMVSHNGGTAQDLGEIKDGRLSFNFNVDGPIEVWITDTPLEKYSNSMNSDVLTLSPEGTIVSGMNGTGSRQSAARPMMAGRSLMAGAPGAGSGSAANPGTLPTPPEGMSYVEDEDWSYTVHLPDPGWSKTLNGTNPDGEDYVPGLLKYDGDGDQYLYYIASISESNLSEGTEAIFTLDGENVLTANDDTTILSVTNVVPVKTHIEGTKVFTNGSDPSRFSFTVSSDDSDAPLPSVATIHADSNGSITFGDMSFPLSLLSDGSGGFLQSRQFTYKVAEDAPAGYTFTEADRTAGSKIINGIEYDTSVRTVTVTLTCQDGHLSVNPNPALLNGSFNNRKLVEVTIHILKVNEKDHTGKLKDAEFQILKKDESGNYAAYDCTGKTFAAPETVDNSKQKTDSKGELSFSGLLAGQYKLIETKTPAGFIKVEDNDIYFTVSVDGAVTWTKADGTEIAAAADKPAQVEYASGSKTFTVGNTPGAALPNAGGQGTGLFTILGSILSLGAGILLLRRRRAV